MANRALILVAAVALVACEQANGAGIYFVDVVDDAGNPVTTGKISPNAVSSDAGIDSGTMGPGDLKMSGATSPSEVDAMSPATGAVDAKVVDSQLAVDALAASDAQITPPPPDAQVAVDTQLPAEWVDPKVYEPGCAEVADVCTRQNKAWRCARELLAIDRDRGLAGASPVHYDELYRSRCIDWANVAAAKFDAKTGLQLCGMYAPGLATLSAGEPTKAAVCPHGQWCVAVAPEVTQSPFIGVCVQECYSAGSSCDAIRIDLKTTVVPPVTHVAGVCNIYKGPIAYKGREASYGYCEALK